MGFNADFQQSSVGFTVEDFDRLIAQGRITIRL